VVKAPGQGEMGGVAGHGMETGQDLGHPAVLHLEHPLHRLVVQPVHAPFRPGGHALDDVESLPVAAVDIHIEEAGHDFMERIPGSPNPFSLDDPVDELLGESAEVAAPAQGLLAPGQLGDEGIRLRRRAFSPEEA